MEMQGTQNCLYTSTQVKVTLHQKYEEKIIQRVLQVVWQMQIYFVCMSPFEKKHVLLTGMLYTIKMFNSLPCREQAVVPTSLYNCEGLHTGLCVQPRTLFSHSSVCCVLKKLPVNLAADNPTGEVLPVNMYSTSKPYCIISVMFKGCP